MLSNRQIQMVKYLIRKDTYVTLSQIADEFEISARTVRNDLDAVEYALRGQPISLERKPRVGIKVNVEKGFDLEAFLEQKDMKNSSKEDRIWKIIMVLAMTGKSTIEDMALNLQVSKNTMVADIKTVESYLNQHDIFLSKKSYYGMELEGEEVKIRNLLYNTHIRLLNHTAFGALEFIEHYSEIDKSLAVDLIHYVEQADEIQYSDRALLELEGIILMSLNRMSAGNYVIKNMEMQHIENEEIFYFIQEYFLTKNKIKATDGDICYLSTLFRSAKVLNRRKKGKAKENDANHLLCRQLIEEFTDIMRIEIDFEDDLIEKLMLHIKIAIIRLKNNIKIENVLLDDIQYSTSFMYDITRTLLRKYEKRFGIIFPDEEIAFITMYFEVIFQEHVKDETNLKIIIVCNGGIATSTLLKQRLSIIMPELRVFKVCRFSNLEMELKDTNPDLIISTLSLNLPDYTYVKVNPVLNPEDVRKLSAVVSELTYKKQNDYLLQRIDRENLSPIQNLLNPKYCQFGSELTDWKEAIRQATLPLLKDKKVKEEYINEMIKVVQEMGNYMIFIPEIAFVHSKPENVMETSIAVLNLVRQIDFGSKTISPVKVIVVVANKEENHMLADLVKLLLIGNNIDSFKNAKRYADLLELREE